MRSCGDGLLRGGVCLHSLTAAEGTLFAFVQAGPRLLFFESEDAVAIEEAVNRQARRLPGTGSSNRPYFLPFCSKRQNFITPNAEAPPPLESCSRRKRGRALCAGGKSPPSKTRRFVETTNSTRVRRTPGSDGPGCFVFFAKSFRSRSCLLVTSAAREPFSSSSVK